MDNIDKDIVEMQGIIEGRCPLCGVLPTDINTRWIGCTQQPADRYGHSISKHPLCLNSNMYMAAYPGD